MYRTIWRITDTSDEFSIEITYYHLGKDPKLPAWCVKPHAIREIEILFEHKLIFTLKNFIKCLKNDYKIKNVDRF